MMSCQRIRVAVVYGSFLTRVGLTATFAACADMVVCAMDSSDPSLLDFDVVVADWRSGLAILDKVKRHRFELGCPRVAIVAGSDQEWQIRQAVEYGAAAYVLIGASGEELVDAARTVHAGRCHLSPMIAAKLAQSLAAERLTAREEQVLALVSEGLCNKRISKRLDIGVGTVKTHLRAAFDKLQVRSRAQAIVMAKRRGLLRHPSASGEEVGASANFALGDPIVRAEGQAQRSPQFDAVGGS
jgi:DNA-binding NarL/FixJ family response regulator